jgi:drug/metabolite transporter (DMT)-like permease
LPVVSVALGAVVLDEALSLRIVAGMLVVLVGVGLTRRHKRPPPATTRTRTAAPPSGRTGDVVAGHRR